MCSKLRPSVSILHQQHRFMMTHRVCVLNACRAGLFSDVVVIKAYSRWARPPLQWGQGGLWDLWRQSVLFWSRLCCDLLVKHDNWGSQYKCHPDYPSEQKKNWAQQMHQLHLSHGHVELVKKWLFKSLTTWTPLHHRQRTWLFSLCV